MALAFWKRMDRARRVMFFTPLFLGGWILLLMLYDHLPPLSLFGDLHPNQALDFLSQNGTGHTVTIEHCFACAYGRQAFGAEKMLKTQFPGIDVVHVNYPYPPWRRVVREMVLAVCVGSIGSVAVGDRIFPKMGITPPPWFYQMSAAKMYNIYAILAFRALLMPIVLHTGAFEVYLDEKVVFSKLDQRGFPLENELSHFISQKLRDSTYTS